MRSYLTMLYLAVTSALVLSSPVYPADDWSFIAGKYALDPEDCKLMASAQSFSKSLAGRLSKEVLTREGITSPREVHCKFRTATPQTGAHAWTVKADCEEMGEPSPADLAVVANPDGSVAITNEDVYGPEALTF